MTAKTRNTYLESVLANCTANKPLPSPAGAEVIPLIREPSKVTLRVYGPDSTEAYTAVVTLRSTDGIFWDKSYVAQITITNADPSDRSLEIPCAQELFGIEVAITGTVGAALTNGQVGINATVMRGW
jgi:hypothetical protein